MGSIALIIHPFPHPKIFLWGSLVQEKMWSNGHIVHEGSYPTPGTMLWVEIENNPSTSNKWAPSWIYSDATQHVLIQITWSNYTVQPIITVVRLKTRFSEGMKLKCKSSEDHMPYWTLLLWGNTILAMKLCMFSSALRENFAFWWILRKSFANPFVFVSVGEKYESTFSTGGEGGRVGRISIYSNYYWNGPLTSSQNG